MTTVIPYLTVDDGPSAVEFYRRAFGAEVSARYDDGDRLGHATLEIGAATIFVSDQYPQLGAVAPKTLGGSSAAIVLTVDDPDTVYASAVEAGATPDRPIEVDGGGERSGWLVDPFGHRWNIRAAG